MAVSVIVGAVAGGAAVAMGAAIATAVIVGVVVAGATAYVIDAMTPEVPDIASQEQGLMVNKASNNASLKVIYGTRKVGGTRIFVEIDGSDNKYLHQVLAVCEGEVEEITEIYAKDEKIWENGSMISGTDYETKIEFYPMLGTDAQASEATLTSRVARWTSQHKLSGVCYVYIRLEYDQDVFYNGIPQLNFTVKGKKVYDPRTATTVWSDNPALCIRDFLTNDRYGRGLSATDIDDTAFTTAANYCENAITITLGGVSKQRYTCDGVADPEYKTMTVLREMLTSCRGYLVFTGGKYKLVLDKVATASYTFSEDNIIGKWTIGMGHKNSTFNRVRANFFNPDRDWQADVAPVESSTFKTDDGEQLLEKTIELKFTADIDRAKYIATQFLNQSRQQVAVQFTATIDALRCEVGDVVYIKHATPGWETLNGNSGKKFRIMKMTIKPTDEVVVDLLEYDAEVYSITVNASDSSPNTSLPDMKSVATPNGLAVTEELYEIRGGSGLKNKAIISWVNNAAFVSHYVVEWKKTTESTWYSAITDSTTFEALDVLNVSYDFRVKALNVVRVSSDWTTRTQEIFGLVGPPYVVEGLEITVASGTAILSWDLHRDVDVRIGGHINFRHQSVLTGATWTSSTSIGSAVTGKSTQVSLPLKSGTYLAKAVDSAGHESTTTASVITNAPSAGTLTSLATITEDPSYAGTHSGTTVSSNILKLASGNSTGTYTFNNSIDLGSVRYSELSTVIGSQVSNEASTVDARTDLIDTWGDFDGIGSASGDIRVHVRHKDMAGDSWSSWGLLNGVGSYNHRYLEFKAILTVTETTYNVNVSQLGIQAYG
jgi:predicted phage tail protein